MIYLLLLQPQSKFFPIQMFYNLVHFTFSFLSKFVAGQFLITVFDYYVLKIEKTLDFCVPQENSGNGSPKSLIDNERPMPWIFFIPVLIFLRVLRFYLSVFSIIIGRGEVTAKQMVNYKITKFLIENLKIQIPLWFSANESGRFPPLLPECSSLCCPRLFSHWTFVKGEPNFRFRTLAVCLQRLWTHNHDEAPCRKSWQHARWRRSWRVRRGEKVAQNFCFSSFTYQIIFLFFLCSSQIKAQDPPKVAST